MIEKYEDLDLMHTLLGIGADVETLALECLNLGVGVHSGYDVPSYLECVVVSDIIPAYLDKTIEKISGSIKEGFEDIIMELPRILYTKLESIFTQLAQALIPIGIKAPRTSKLTLVILIYKKEKEADAVRIENNVQINYKKKINNICWYVIESRSVSVGGILA